MRRAIYALMVCLFFPFMTSAQSEDDIKKIAWFLGVSSEEEVSSEEFELLQDALKHPLKVNLTSRSRLISSGLLTAYQAASLIDYRRRFGNVLSYAELAMVDGFGQHYVEVLKPFISLDTGGQGDLSVTGTNKAYNELSLRGGYRYAVNEQDWQYGLKYGLDLSRFRLSLGASRSRTAKTGAPSDYTGSFLYDFKKIDARVILGDYNARFGQGLLAWNGAFMNSLTSPSGYMKKPSGITPVRSFTGSVANTGIASEFGIGRFLITAAYDFHGLKIANVRRLGKMGSIGLTTGYDGAWKSSVDAAVCINGVNLFGESVYDWTAHSTAFVAGTDFSPYEKLRIASLLNWTQGKQWQAAFSGDLIHGNQRKGSLIFSSDFLYHLIPKDKSVKHSIQVKSQLRWEYKVWEQLTFRLRLTDRFRTWGLQHRTELRLETAVPLKSWILDTRVHVLKSRSHSALAYIDASYKTSAMTLHLRAGAFCVDNWDDRIYVYEYDAPGSFNVPAYYGRGVWAASVLSWKLSRVMRLYIRGSYISYPFMPTEKKKPGRAELKLQSVFKF